MTLNFGPPQTQWRGQRSHVKGIFKHELGYTNCSKYTLHDLINEPYITPLSVNSHISHGPRCMKVTQYIGYVSATTRLHQLRWSDQEWAYYMSCHITLTTGLIHAPLTPYTIFASPVLSCKSKINAQLLHTHVHTCTANCHSVVYIILCTYIRALIHRT